MKYAILCVKSHPVLRFEIRAIFVASQTKACKKSRFLTSPHSDAMSNKRIKNRRPGGESTHKIAYFIHKLIFGTANTQILNWSEICGDSHILKTCERSKNTYVPITTRFRIPKSYLVRFFVLIGPFRLRFFPTGRPPIILTMLRQD